MLFEGGRSQYLAELKALVTEGQAYMVEQKAL